METNSGGMETTTAMMTTATMTMTATSDDNDNGDDEDSDDDDINDDGDDGEDDDEDEDHGFREGTRVVVVNCCQDMPAGQCPPVSERVRFQDMPASSASVYAFRTCPPVQRACVYASVFIEEAVEITGVVLHAAVKSSYE